MAKQSLKFLKGIFPADYEYENGAIYFDNASHEIRVGNEENGFDRFGSNIKDVVFDPNNEQHLKISFWDGRAEINIDLSDVASASGVAARFEEVEDAIEEVAEGLGGLKEVVGQKADEEHEATGIFKDLDELKDGKVASVNAKAGEKVVDVDTNDNKEVTIGINISAEEGNIIEVKNDGLYATAIDGAEYSMVKDENPGDYAAVYHLTKNGEPVGEPINIAKDQFLKSADFYKDAASVPDGKRDYGDGFEFPGIRFEFETSAGKSVSWVSVKDLVDVYTAGEGIVIDNNEISVKVAEGEGNFLEVDEDGLKVTKITTNATKMSDEIQVAGGPVQIDSESWPFGWKDEAGNNIIPDNLSMQEILTGLFLKVQNGSLKDPVYNWNPTAKTPTATLADASTSVEINSTHAVTFAKVEGCNNPDAKATVEQLTSYGMFVGDSDEWKDANYKYEQIQEGVPTYNELVVYGAWNGVDVESGTDVVATQEGENKLIVTQSGAKCTVNEFDADVLYPSTNTKVKLETGSKTIDPKGLPATAKTLANTTTSKTFNAYYPIYTNGVTSSTSDVTTPTVTPVADYGTKLPLVADAKEFGVAFGAMVDGGEGYCLVIKKGKTITQAKALNGMTAKYDIDIKNNFVKGETITKLSGGVEEDYDVYEYRGTEGANRVNFKID